MKISHNRMLGRLSGISTPIAGVSWHPPKKQIKLARKLLTYLEGCRVLYNPFALEGPKQVVQSVTDIRKTIVDTLDQTDESSDLASTMNAMKAACRKFLIHAEYTEKTSLDSDFSSHNNLPLALGELRGVMGILIAQLCVKYGLDLEERLASILPTSPKRIEETDQEDMS